MIATDWDWQEYEYSRGDLFFAASFGDAGRVKEILNAWRREGQEIDAADAEEVRSRLSVRHVNPKETLAEYLDQRDSLGATPLFWAVWGAHFEVVALLLEAGSDPNSFTDGAPLFVNSHCISHHSWRVSTSHGS